MSPFPSHKPQNLSLGPLESEILGILWKANPITAKVIHNEILEDINRELTYSSVATILNRLEAKVWVSKKKEGKAFTWKPTVSQTSAKILKAHAQLQQFLAISNPDIVAAFADTLDDDSLEQLTAITERIQAARTARDRVQHQEQHASGNSVSTGRDEPCI